MMSAPAIRFSLAAATFKTSYLRMASFRSLAVTVLKTRLSAPTIAKMTVLRPKWTLQPLGSRFASTNHPTAQPIKLASTGSTGGDYATPYNNGLQSFSRGDYADAERWFRKALKIEPNSADAQYNLGNTLISLGRSDEALQAWQASLSLKPNQSDVLVNIANVYALHKGDMKQAALNYEAALRVSEDPQTRFNYAVILEKDGQLAKAVDQYRLALKGGITQADKYMRNAIIRLASSSPKPDGDKN